MKNIVIGAVATLVVVILGYLFWQSFTMEPENETTIPNETNNNTNQNNNNATSTATSTNQQGEEDKTKTVIGTSVEERDITAYHYGEGDKDVLFIGGIHGGYGWNTTLLAYELMDYLQENPEAIPEDVRVTVIPVLNPDGLEAVVGSDGRFDPDDAPTGANEIIAGRFNENEVDLNRNFDCDWQESSTWQQRQVSGGSQAFSEPESQALRDYIEANRPDAVVVWYSAAGGVFASSCYNDVLPETKELTAAYAKAAGYRAFEEFDFYEITGDMVNWLAKEEIPAISVLLTNHTDAEWSKNQKGIQAVLDYYAEDES